MLLTSPLDRFEDCYSDFDFCVSTCGHLRSHSRTPLTCQEVGSSLVPSSFKRPDKSVCIRSCLLKALLNAQVQICCFSIEFLGSRSSCCCLNKLQKEQCCSPLHSKPCLQCASSQTERLSLRNLCPLQADREPKKAPAAGGDGLLRKFSDALRIMSKTC